MARKQQVADFNTIEDLIEHAERELGATHVTVELVRGTGRAGPGTKIYFPRSGQYPYEEARVWRESRYWHTEGPGARTGIQQLPDNAMTIERYLTRGGQRRAAEGHSDPLKQAKSAGDQYARDQIDGDYFQDWVRAQIYEASRMDPSQVLPLETKDDAKVIAKNTLQQLGWDTKRELASFDILKMIGASGDDIDESAILNAFYEGFDEALHDPNVVDWLADEILHTHEQTTGRTAESATREAAHRESRTHGIADQLDSIKILFVAPDTLALWGVPYGMRRGQQPGDLWRAHNTKGWIWLGSPGWWGNMPREDQAAVEAFLAKHSDSIPGGPYEWTELRTHEQATGRTAEGTEEAKRKRHPEMTGGAFEFAELLKSLVDTQGRSLNIQTEHRLGGPSRYYESVYVNFVNLPTEIVARKAGGGAEAQNNKMSFWVEGFDGADPHAPPPTGKVKVEMQTSALPREYWLRAKTGPPGAIAHYLADFINKVVREVPPNYTHSRPGTDEAAKRQIEVPMDYAQAKERGDELEAEVDRTDRALKALSGGGPLGLTPADVRATLEWKEAKRAFDDAFAALQAFNKVFVRRFKREIKREREEIRRDRQHLLRPGAREAQAPHGASPPKRFKSPGGRTFMLGKMQRTPPRFEGDRSWQEMWPILYKSDAAGKLFRSDTYRAPLEWHATTRELYWKYAKDAPTGIGFDVAAFATPQEALDAWGRSADQILDWHESKLRRSRKKR